MIPAKSCKENFSLNKNMPQKMPYVEALLDKLAKVSTFDIDVRNQSLENFQYLGKKTKKKYITSAFALSAINKSKLARKDINNLSLAGSMSMTLSKQDIEEMDLMTDQDKLSVQVDDLEKKLTGKSLRSMDKYTYITEKIEERYDQTVHQFWNTYNCMKEFEAIQESKSKIVKVQSHHCKNNFCMTCAGIKAFKSYKKYEKLIENDDYYLGTITHKNCDYDNLRITIDRMRKKMKSIRKSYLKYCKANRIKYPSGIIKVEITYNRDNRTYHPHFHILTDSEDYLIYTVNAWTKHFGQNALEYLQDIKKADKNSILEIFKYFVKIIWNDKETNEIKYIPPKELFKITFATRGLHFYQSFGDFYGYKADQEEDSIIEGEKLFTGYYNFILKTYIDDDQKEIVSSEVDEQTEEIVAMIKPKFKKLEQTALQNIIPAKHNDLRIDNFAMKRSCG